MAGAVDKFAERSYYTYKEEQYQQQPAPHHKVITQYLCQYLCQTEYPNRPLHSIIAASSK